MHLSWYIDGMSWERYLALPRRLRFSMHDELMAMVEESKAPSAEDDEGAPARPKQMRK